ncbi:outer membrane lipoprotein carrier protein LolA [Trinickia fusca]|uniref:Outer membrane lipoprotein carrier protein LolA n=1 Tax=Trinickia fusca TaxID=2419777 RepID=A0A494XJE5_9BURK|nr:outer membrane lipoprotein carrier protein LolA [Trinickia fusca]RKP50708.1 outer membrane lipoprotein carrier protein LolA [Trinickia fusca]
MAALIRTRALALTLALGMLGAFGGLSVAAQAATAASAPAANTADDARLVAQITALLAGKPGVRAQFRQTQTLAALKAPLVSTGSLVFWRERGVLWRIDTPYRTTYVIGDVGVSEIDANGKRVSRASPRAGGIAQVSRMMRAMLGGDLSALYSQFDVTASGTLRAWRLELAPNQPQLAQAIKSLHLDGDTFLRTLVITAANGDTTRIDFTDSAAFDAPAPNERALWGTP